MGVPAFFRWLTKKYPSIIVNANEDRQRNADGTRIPIDATKPNPNFQEFDNLYLDMNGIIHPCTHPEDRPPPANEDEMFALIFEYIDRIFSIVRPRKLLYMAIDGVAPRAKMNQQRSRRFRASKEAWEKQASIEEQRRRLEEEGLPLPPRKENETHFDSNCITPGTPFMARLADALRYYIHDRITTDPAWAKIQVILSDANVPGEGEHKIMDFIRKQRSNPAHNPNTVHCLCGADADLIMLGLATHEANFNIIREEFLPHQQRPCELCGQYGHELKNCRGLENEEKGPEQGDPISKEKNFIFLRIPVLREYLERELVMENLPFKYDFERVIDDWVFLCFFVGNDFLPHLPSLEIREGAIDRLVKLYKDMVYSMKGYLTKDGAVYMDRVERIMLGLGEVEDEIFKRRQQEDERFKAIQKAKKARLARETRPQAPSYIPQPGSLIAPERKATPLSGETTRALAASARVEAMRYSENEEAARRLKMMLKAEGTTTNEVENNNRKRKADAPLDLDSDEEETVDEIRLFESGWKDRYYRAKFDVGAEDVEFRRKVAWAYVEGLCWVLKYYYQGCVSWDWYFPYHYAPFASDFDTVSKFKPNFSSTTKPFKPLEQLMSVFPAASRQHLPIHWQKLMIDDDSPIIDLYPIDFRIDLNGKKFAWQGVALLPFVDEVRLLKTLESVQHTLTEEEIARNKIGPNRIFIGRNHPAFDFFKELYTDGDQTVKSVDIDPAFTYGVAGRITTDTTAVAPDQPFLSPVKDKSCPDLPVNGAIMVIYEDPCYPEGFIFPARRLENAQEIPRTLRDYSDNRSGSDYRPQIGFTRDVPGRASLDSSAHRFVQRNVPYDTRPYDNRGMQASNRGGMHDGGGRPGAYNTGMYSRGGYGRGTIGTPGYHNNSSYGGFGTTQSYGNYDRPFSNQRGFVNATYGNRTPNELARGRGGYFGRGGRQEWR
ncbi:5'-3' exoribonuclease 2 [Parelaphostrongylus tenuis]|uniref:5'-3' exoribonuclease n=1 Tax=Parelaphostrongylus tenuis TaxID=148309 RepID=A0AAD5LUR7_PARTN|nr:5'-3' exoribonuclease 2 [Parelaphostrongylus tenuis]